jgi:hypothetical protein
MTAHDSNGMSGPSKDVALGVQSLAQQVADHTKWVEESSAIQSAAQFEVVSPRWLWWVGRSIPVVLGVAIVAWFLRLFGVL